MGFVGRTTSGFEDRMINGVRDSLEDLIQLLASKDEELDAAQTSLEKAVEEIELLKQRLDEYAQWDDIIRNAAIIMDEPAPEHLR